MRKLSQMMRGMAAATALIVASPAFAGDEERALAAIAQAQGKIDSANQVRAGELSPEVLARANASLKLAREALKSGKEQRAIEAAVEAQQFAETAIGQAQQNNTLAAEAQGAAVADAQSQAAQAQAQAAEANARADAAALAAQSAAAEARAARAAPPATTVTTETVKTTPTAVRVTSTAPKKKVVAKKRTTTVTRPATTERTTTTVTTEPST